MFSAFLDTCVLYPSTLRDILLELGSASVFRPLWSDKIEEELKKVILKRFCKKNREINETYVYITRLLRLMDQSLPDARVTGWESILPRVPSMQDANDRHVVAAAILGRADVIVTFNLDDFKEEVLPGALFSQSPDDFLLNLLGMYPCNVKDAISTIARRSGRKGPKWTEEDVLDRLKNSRVDCFVSEYRSDEATST